MDKEQTNEDQNNNENLVEPEVVSEGEENGAERDVAQLQGELADMQDKYLRVVAEMENLRRRTERERTDLLKYANEGIVTELLPVLDSFDKALDQVDVDDEQHKSNPLLQGLHMIQKQFHTTLEKHGVVPIEAEGAEFDPNCHQAVQMLPSPDVEVQRVKEVFAKGYTLNGRLIRAAMVSVLVPESN